MKTTGKTIEDLLAAYREAAIGMDEQDPKRASKYFANGHACYKVLKDSNQGRQGIIALMYDENPHVRCSAAAHALQWVPDEARGVLEVLRHGLGPCSFEAKMVLREFDAGRLTFDF